VQLQFGVGSGHLDRSGAFLYEEDVINDNIGELQISDRVLVIFLLIENNGGVVHSVALEVLGTVPAVME
jgi:VCBS repeat-containing protein